MDGPPVGEGKHSHAAMPYVVTGWGQAARLLESPVIRQLNGIPSLPSERLVGWIIFH